MNMLDRSAFAAGAEAAARHIREAGRPSSQWTDNVARVYAVIAQHPEIEMKWPGRPGGGEFWAKWPGGECRTMELARVADALEAAFPPSAGG